MFNINGIHFISTRVGYNLDKCQFMRACVVTYEQVGFIIHGPYSTDPQNSQKQFTVCFACLRSTLVEMG